MEEVLMPKLGESVTEGTIEKWLVKPGDTVEEYDALCEVITDKVTAEVPSVFDGTIKELLVDEGDTVEVGTPICMMETEGGADETAVDSVEEPTPAHQEPVRLSKAPKNADARKGTRTSPPVITLPSEN